jgi:hypothetical protein
METVFYIIGGAIGIFLVALLALIFLAPFFALGLYLFDKNDTFAKWYYGEHYRPELTGKNRNAVVKECKEDKDAVPDDTGDEGEDARRKRASSVVGYAYISGGS